MVPWQRNHSTSESLNAPSYHGKCSNEWKRELEDWAIISGHLDIPDPICLPQSRWRLFLEGQYDIRRPPLPVERERPAILEGDFAAMPVLVELVHDDAPSIRALALWGLYWIGPPAKPALPSIRTTLEDPDSMVRKVASTAQAGITGEKK
jgi:hypothetical protein